MEDDKRSSIRCTAPNETPFSKGTVMGIWRTTIPVSPEDVLILAETGDIDEIIDNVATASI
jgi:hypothetical protein